MKKLLIALAVVLLIGSSACADPIVDLSLSSTPIHVGDVFDVQVLVDGNGIGEELLAFGFNIGTLQRVSYVGYSLNSSFDDDSAYSGLDVSGSAFPGVPDDDLAIATLSFKALSEGLGSIALDGTLDTFSGLYYEVSSFGFAPSLTFNIEAATVPEPASMLLVGSGLIGMAAFGWKFKI